MTLNRTIADNFCFISGHIDIHSIQIYFQGPCLNADDVLF